MQPGVQTCTNCGTYYPQGVPSPKPARNPNRVWLLAGIGGCLAIMLTAICLVTGIFLLSFATVPDHDADLNPNTSGPSASSSDNTREGNSGDVLLSDNFSDERDSTFVAAEDAYSSYLFERGEYRISVVDPQTMVWSLADGKFRSVAINVDTTFSEAEPAFAAGVVFNYQDPDNFYLFSLSSEGFYSLDVLEDNNWTTLIDWTETDALAPYGSPNRVSLEVGDGQIRIVLNGERLDTMRDATFESGNVGLAVSSFDDGNVTARFDNFAILGGE